MASRGRRGTGSLGFKAVTVERREDDFQIFGDLRI